MPELFTKVVRAKMKQTGVSGLDEYVSGNYPKKIPGVPLDITTVQTSANGKGLCKKEHDFYILKLSGTHYEMGYQHGYLLANHIDSSGAKDESEKWFAGHTLIDYWGRYLEKTLPRMVHPREMINELIKRISDDNFRGLYGFWKGYLAKTEQKENEQTRTIRDFIIAGYVLPDICSIVYANMLGGQHTFGRIAIGKGDTLDKNPPGTLGCSSAAFLPSRTKNKDLIYGFNFDYGPLAGLWEQKQAIIFFKPVAENVDGTPKIGNSDTQPQSYLAISSAGMHTDGLMGVNENGITYRVQMNFTTKTDYPPEPNTNKNIGQPLLNFGTHILRKAKDIASPYQFGALIEDIRNGLSDDSIKSRTRNFTAAGWTHIVTQARKTDNNKDNSKVHICQMIAGEKKIETIPRDWPLNDRGDFAGEITRWSLFDDLYSQHPYKPIETIWETNFYVDDDLRKTDILERRTCQLDRLGRYLRIGQMIKEKYRNPDYKFKWEDAANILADEKDIFSGNKPRMNVHTVASLTNVATAVFSVKPAKNPKKPSIDLYIADRKQTPTSWGDYYKLNFKEFANSKYLKEQILKPAKSNKLKKPDDITREAWKRLYRIYREYTFRYEIDSNKRKICQIIAMYTGDKTILCAGDTIEKRFLLIPFLKEKGKVVDPILYSDVSLLYSRLSELETGNAESHLEKAKEYLEKTIESTKQDIIDAHLRVISLYYLAKIEFALAYLKKDYNNEYISARKRLDELILIRDTKNLSYDLDLTDDEKKNVLPHFGIPIPAGHHAGFDLKYTMDRKLKEAVENLEKAKFCWPEHVETHSLHFDGPGSHKFDKVSNARLLELQKTWRKDKNEEETWFQSTVANT